MSYNVEKLQQIDIETTQKELKETESSWFVGKWMGYRKIRSIFQEAQKEDSSLKITEDVLQIDIGNLEKLRNLELEIESLNELSHSTDNLWNGLQTSVEDILLGIEFQTFLSNRLSTKLNEEHVNIRDDYEAILDGKCGAIMQKDLKLIDSMQALLTKLEKFHTLKEKTNGVWLGLDTDIAQVEDIISFQKAISNSLSKIAKTPESIRLIKESLNDLLGDANMLLEQNGLISTSGVEFNSSLDRFSQSVEDLSESTGRSETSLGNFIEEDPKKMRGFCNEIINFEQKINSWCAWIRIREQAVQKGLLPLTEALENKRIEPDEILEAFNTNYAQWWINTIVENDDILKTFVSATHERYIEDFRSLDQKFTDLTCAYVRSGLCSNLPDHDEAKKNTEWGILRREMQKKRRHMPLREMMKQIPNVITKLAPCLMMSPLSIAQYLSADTALFDIVVFDEASQISVWDAIGAIARAKQVVLVGDPKQLPPTSFFDRTEADGEYDPDVEEDLESILDECLGASLPTMNLMWHYRSRHESLISFSNNRYYGGGLITFPSPATKDRAVRFHFQQNGIYEKGGARINKPEAAALVEHIINRLNDKAFKKSNLTIGVVTFNSEQQNLIENLLDNERRKDPSIESFFSDDNVEPLFVKNLESVQGDERDIMYFSITYGPDISGSISMNFGPMNRDGGERRLNVAITRARQELHIFSSLRTEQIDLSRTRALGVRDLKHFMEYAEQGSKALASSNYGSIGDYESPFEQAVANALIQKGWIVHPQVGVSSFRIDLGIVNPDVPGKYLAGIECDGATYHRSATARDRDKVREQVLVNLGWDIIRIWSTDWWIDAGGSIEKVHSTLVNLLGIHRESAKLKDMSDEEIIELDEIEAIKEQEPATNESASKAFEIVETKEDSIEKVPEKVQDVNLKYAKANYEHRESSDVQIIFHPYSIYSCGELTDPRQAEGDEIASNLMEIINIEGPMLAKRAYDIYLKTCGIKRMGKELKKIMNKSLQILVRQGDVVIQDEMNIGGLVYTYIRTKDTQPIVLRERGPRTFNEIPPSEVLIVANYIRAEAKEHIENDDQLYRNVLNEFDLKRLTAATKERLDDILALDLDYVDAWLESNGVSVP